MPLFALANAGVDLRQLDLHDAAAASVFAQQFDMTYPSIVDASGAEAGAVQEPRSLALRFAYGMHLPGASQQVQAFLLVATYLVRR